MPTELGGEPPLSASLSTFFNQYFKPIRQVKPEHVVLTAGASDAIEQVIHAVCDDGDSIITPRPCWRKSGGPHCCARSQNKAGFEPLVATRANVNIIVAQLPTYTNHASCLGPSPQAAYDLSPIKKHIKSVLLSNSSNPLGRCYSKSVLIESCQERELHLICDELYALTDLEHVKKGEGFVSVLTLTDPSRAEGAIEIDPDRVHVLWSGSKLLGLNGLRVVSLRPSKASRLAQLIQGRAASSHSTILSLSEPWLYL